ncbi:hypothetical protein GLO73106DRAFT_00020850 [Gloeocapsa sp. PCC 73106]|nr:hypothetical protein GLO73106DRAFT_00020850 [Gloeocapsa sp. PCC 73106]
MQLQHTYLLVATKENTKKGQDFSRHKSSAAIAKYDDNLKANQCE